MKTKTHILLAAIAIVPALALAGDISGTNTVTGFLSSANGNQNTVTGPASFATGQLSFVPGAVAFVAGQQNFVQGNWNAVFGYNNTAGPAGSFNIIGGTGNTATASRSLIIGNNARDNGRNGSVILTDSNPFGIRTNALPLQSPANDSFTTAFNGGYRMRTTHGQGANPNAGLFVLASGTQSSTVSVPAFMGINKPVPTQALDVVGNGNFVGNIVLSDGTGTLPPIANPGVQVTGGNFPFVTTGSSLQRFLGQAHGGTATAPTAVTSGQLLVALHGAGWNGSDFSASRARIEFSANETWSGTANGTRIGFFTALNGTTSVSEQMTITDSGRVGIGTTTPGVPLDVVGTANPPIGAITYFFQGAPNLIQGSGAGEITIRASRQIAAFLYLAFSDERIKNIQGRSDSEADLRTLLGIEVTDYLYKDVVEKGGRHHKKVIAQQVEKVFPQAVSTSTDVLPDIFKKAPIKDGWVELATDLKVGDRVRLITEKGHRAVHEVIEVKDGKFRTDFVEDAGQVFVYGREVKDFRSVDYEAISMLNVSATQELASKVEAKDAEIARLTAKLAALEARDDAREARLARLEAADKDRPAHVVRAVLDLKASNR